MVTSGLRIPLIVTDGTRVIRALPPRRYLSYVRASNHIGESTVSTKQPVFISRSRRHVASLSRLAALLKEL